MKHHIHIKTFKKPDLLCALLGSLRKHNYPGESVSISVGDDNPGESLDILEEFEFVDAYLTGDTHGIWANNNRGIKYFLENSDADSLLLLDNDIEFIESGVLQEIELAHRADKQSHITGFTKGLDGVDGLQVVFPSVVESEYLKWHPGTHGTLLWQTRKLVEAVGYQLEYSYFYGAEHAEYSHRCLAAQKHSTIGLYPVLKRSANFLRLNPNDRQVYNFDIEKVMETNQKQMLERDAQTMSGNNLCERHHHLKKELVIKRGDKVTVKDLLARLN